MECSYYGLRSPSEKLEKDLPEPTNATRMEAYVGEKEIYYVSSSLRPVVGIGLYRASSYDENSHR